MSFPAPPPPGGQLDPNQPDAGGAQPNAASPAPWDEARYNQPVQDNHQASAAAEQVPGVWAQPGAQAPWTSDASRGEQYQGGAYAAAPSPYVDSGAGAVKPSDADYTPHRIATWVLLTIQTVSTFGSWIMSIAMPYGVADELGYKPEGFGGTVFSCLLVGGLLPTLVLIATWAVSWFWMKKRKPFPWIWPLIGGFLGFIMFMITAGIAGSIGS